MPRAAPGVWPYNHRSMADIMEDERKSWRERQRLERKSLRNGPV
jgi:hypothetical protein